MKLVKEKCEYNGYNITVIIGKSEYTSFWSAPPKDEKCFDIDYLIDRYPVISTKKKLKQFNELYRNLWLEITDEQLNDMKHALGLDRKKKPYRNRYYSESNNKDWEDLVNKGLADKMEEQPNRTSYWLTKQGVEYVIEKTISDRVYEEL